MTLDEMIKAHRGRAQIFETFSPFPEKCWEEIGKTWLAGVSLPVLCSTSKRSPKQVMDVIRALGLPDRHPTMCEIQNDGQRAS
jgi:hypothetical protein